MRPRCLAPHPTRACASWPRRDRPAGPMTTRTRLVLGGAALALIWQLPYGQMALYPLSLLATFTHEMGHGLSALLLGQQFEQMLLYADGSGLAMWRGQPSALDRALIAAGGLLGPTLAGTGLLLMARSERFARAALALLALLLLTCVALWVRNGFGIGFVLGLALALLLAARWLPRAWASGLLHLMALTLCLSWFSDLGYMFSEHAQLADGRVPSDSAQIAQALGLTYWFWGGLIAAISLLTVVLGITAASRKTTGTM